MSTVDITLRSPDVPEMSVADHAELDTLLGALEAETWPEDFAAAREFYDAWGTPVAADIAVTEHCLGGVASYLATPPGADPTRIGLWLHGGGYVFGSQRSHGSMIAEVARAAGFAITHLQYRRAPENRYPAAFEDALAAYRGLLDEGWDPQSITLVGDSAGGGLILAVMLYLREHDLPLPAAAACISPWVDLEGTGESFTANDEIDPLISSSVVSQVREAYLGQTPVRTPYASPLYGQLDGLPPILIQVGEREMLLSDAERLARKLREAGGSATLEVWPGMVHVWHLHHTRLAKAREGIDRLGAFLRSPGG
ncbi:MAG: alpha/beta hydrolase [Jatrophihabitantaceae bacterium]